MKVDKNHRKIFSFTTLDIKGYNEDNNESKFLILIPGDENTDEINMMKEAWNKVENLI